MKFFFTICPFLDISEVPFLARSIFGHIGNFDDVIFRNVHFRIGRIGNFLLLFPISPAFRYPSYFTRPGFTHNINTNIFCLWKYADKIVLLTDPQWAPNVNHKNFFGTSWHSRVIMICLGNLSSV